MQNGPLQWNDIIDAADILWKASEFPDVNALNIHLRYHYVTLISLLLTSTPINCNESRRALAVCNGENITLALEGSDQREFSRTCG